MRHEQRKSATQNGLKRQKAHSRLTQQLSWLDAQAALRAAVKHVLARERRTLGRVLGGSAKPLSPTQRRSLSGLLAAAFVCLKPSRACNLASLTLQDGLNIEGLLVNEDKPYACYAVPQRKESVKDNGETFVVVDRLLQDVLRLHRELVRPVVGIHPSPPSPSSSPPASSTSPSPVVAARRARKTSERKQARHTQIRCRTRVENRIA